MIASLADKSPTNADVGGARPRYRMLDSTRYYAAEKLAQRDLKDVHTRMAHWLIGWEQLLAEVAAVWPETNG